MRPLEKLLILGLIGVLLLSFVSLGSIPLASAASAQVEIQPSSKDTELRQDSPTTNYGSEGVISLRDEVNKTHRIIVEFDITTLPENVEITWAKFYFYYEAFADYNPEDKTVWAYKLTRDNWTESHATWNIYETGENWTAAGGDYVTSDPSGGSTTFSASFGWMTWNVLAIVQDAYDNDHPVELLVKFQTEGLAEDYSYPQFYSKEADPSVRPKLVLKYSYTPEPGWGDPISIDGNSDFTEANGVTSGAGTAGNPWIIEDWSIAQSGMTGSCISIQNTTDYFIIRNCIVSNGYNGIYFNNVANGRIENTVGTGNRIGAGGQYVSNSTFDNNDFSNNVDGGIAVAGSTYNTFINNVCKYNSYGITLYFSNTSHHNTVDNNDCSNNGQYGIWLNPSSHDNIKNNTCSNNGSYGIYLYYASNENITNNTCENNIYGIYLASYSNNNLLDSNNCANNSSAGIYMEPSCTNNTVIPFDDGGPVLTGRGPIAISSNSDFTEANGVTSGAGTVLNPYIIENWIINSPSGTLDGISISNTTSYFIIRNCVIGATGQWGEASYRNHDGVHLYKVTNGTIQNNSILYNRGNGIFLEISDNNTIDNNICEDNPGDGIVLSFSSNNVLTNNTCSGSSAGIALQYSSNNNTLDSNTCTGNRNHDFHISSTCVGNILTGNVGTVTYGPVGGETAFTISIDPASQSGLGGATLTYTVTIKNTGEGTDLFTFTVSDTAGWDPLISPASLTLARMGLGTSTLMVYIPVDAENGTTDNITVSVIGTTGLGGSASCTAQITAPSPVTPGVSGLVTLFLPFTDGDAVTAGYLTGIFFFIAPLTIMGLAVVAAAKARQYAGLLILGFFLLGMFMCVLTGLFPWWFLIFIIAVLALVFARGWSGGGKD